MASSPADLGVLSRASAAAIADAVAAVPEPKTRWKTRMLLPWSIIAAAGALLAYSARDAWMPAVPVRVVQVVVKTATDSGNGGAFTIQAPGWVEPDPYPIAVTALADGVVDEVLVLEGQSVKKGDVVARMVPDDARIALARAEAAVREREGELKQMQAVRDAAKREWDNPVERTRAVAAGEAMVAETHATLERLPSEIAAEAARVAELEDLAKRTEKSAAAAAASASELVQVKAKLEAQRAMLAASRATQPVLTAKLRQQEADLTAARQNAKLRIAERRAVEESDASVDRAGAALQQARAARDDAKLRLSRMEIRSPADGIVMTRHAEPGSTMMLSTDSPTSAHAVKLYDPKRLQVRVDVPLADAGKISVGQHAKVVVAVAPDQTFDGEVTRIVPEADIQRNTLQAKVRITSPSPMLRPEMLARVRFETATAGATTASQQVFAPEAMVRTGADGRAAIWVADPSRSAAEFRTVTVGDSHADGWVSISDGLRPGDQLIAGDTSMLHPGHRVKVVGEADVPTAAPPASSDVKGGPRGAH